jgi:hypothetical protein
MTFVPYYSAALKGVNTNISPLLQSPDQPSMLNGCTNTYKIGALTKDLGYEQVGSTIESGKSILGLYNFIQEPGVEKTFATVDDATSDDTQLFYKTAAGAWTEIAAAEVAWANFAGINVEMESFIAYCFFVGYGATDGFLPVGSVTGTTFSTATNVTSMPKAKYIKRYRDRLYVANCQIASTSYPYRVYFSSVPSAGAITWTVATDFIDVDFSDQITGIAQNWDKLIVFTLYSTYFYDQTSFKKVFDYGCSNNRTIATSGPYTMWANSDGVWLSTGGQPQNIAGEVIDFFRNSSNPLNWFAKLVDEEYHIYLGNVSVNGVTYLNVRLTFNIPLSNWRVREEGHNMTIFARYNSSGVQRLYMGDVNGKVYNQGKYTDATLLSSDAGLDIGSNFELAPIHLQAIAKNKRIKSLVTFADKAMGLKLKARVIDRNSRVLTPYKPLGELTQYINSFDPEADEGVLLQIAGTEYGQNTYWSFFGYALDFDDEGNILKNKY